MKLRALTLTLAAIGALASCNHEPGPVPAAMTPPPSSPIRIMPLGDSITAGVGSATGGGYRLPLWHQLTGCQVDFVGSERAGGFADSDHEGHSDYLIEQIRARVDGWMADSRPDVVLLHLGVNDLDRGDRIGAADRLVALVDEIERDRPGVTVIVQGLIPTTGGLEGAAIAFNAMVRSQADDHGFRWVEPPELTAGDMFNRLHPNDLGYQRMAQAFEGAVRQAMTQPSSPLFHGRSPGCSSVSGG